MVIKTLEKQIGLELVKLAYALHCLEMYDNFIKNGIISDEDCFGFLSEIEFLSYIVQKLYPFESFKDEIKFFILNPNERGVAAIRPYLNSLIKEKLCTENNFRERTRNKIFDLLIDPDVKDLNATFCFYGKKNNINFSLAICYLPEHLIEIKDVVINFDSNEKMDSVKHFNKLKGRIL